MDVSNRIHAGRVSASLCCFPLAGGFLLCFAGFRPLLIDYPGGDFLLSTLTASRAPSRSAKRDVEKLKTSPIVRPLKVGAANCRQ